MSWQIAIASMLSREQPSSVDHRVSPVLYQLAIGMIVMGVAATVMLGFVGSFVPA
jgi:hypothetical protein